VVASWLIVFSPGIVALVGGTKYLGSERFVAPVVLGYFMQGVYQFPAMGLFHMNKTKLLPAITVASVILNISLNFAFIPRFGVIVAAWSTFAGFSVMAILGFAICHPIYSLVYPRRPLFAAAAILVGSFSLNQVHGFAFVTLGFKATVWCAALGLLWKLFGQDFLQLTRS
jgi:O-antigen/teichoic acid export membrane protein